MYGNLQLQISWRFPVRICAVYALARNAVGRRNVANCQVTLSPSLKHVLHEVKC